MLHECHLNVFQLNRETDVGQQFSNQCIPSQVEKPIYHCGGYFLWTIFVSMISRTTNPKAFILV